MKNRVTVYTTEPCGYCRTAKTLLDRRGIAYDEINLAKDADGRAELVSRTGMMTFPQVLIDGEPIRPGAYCPAQLIQQHPDRAIDPRWRRYLLGEDAA